MQAVPCFLLVLITSLLPAQAGTVEALPVHTRPTPRHSHAMVYDSHRDRMLLFGETDSRGVVDNWTWELVGQEWIGITTPVAPAPRHRQQFAFDSHRSRVVLFGGANSY